MQNMTLAIGPGTPASNVLSDDVLNVGGSNNNNNLENYSTILGKYTT